uniref:Uncharacterized protein n=1 Tax=Solanum lycopersicum TaxID=4081 RepID=A0A3Q7IE72_SOLLC
MGKRSYIPKEKATIAMMKTTKDGVQAKKKDNKTKSIVEKKAQDRRVKKLQGGGTIISEEPAATESQIQEKWSKTKAATENRKLSRVSNVGFKLDFVSPKKHGDLSNCEIDIEDISTTLLCWKNVVGFYILGAPPFSVLNGFILGLREKHDIKSMLKNEILLMRFENENGKNEIIQGGICLFDNKPFIVKASNKDMEFSREELLTVPIWVKLPGPNFPKSKSATAQHFQQPTLTTQINSPSSPTLPTCPTQHLIPDPALSPLPSSPLTPQKQYTHPENARRRRKVRNPEKNVKNRSLTRPLLPRLSPRSLHPRVPLSQTPDATPTDSPKLNRCWLVVYGMGDKNVYVVNVCFEFAFLVREFTVILILTAAFVKVGMDDIVKETIHEYNSSLVPVLAQE